MNGINGDFPAFSRTGVDSPEHAWGEQDGLTKREYFAIRLLAGLIVSKNYHTPAQQATNASIAVEYANALLKALDGVPA